MAVAGAEFKPPQKLDHLRMQSVNADFKGRPFPFFADLVLHLALGLLGNLLNPARMDPAVRHQLFQGELGNLPAHRVKPGNSHCLRGIVNYHVYPGSHFQGPDIPALPADYPALHLIAGQADHADRGFHGMLHRAALNSQADYLPGLLVRAGFYFILMIFKRHGLFIVQLFG